MPRFIHFSLGCPVCWKDYLLSIVLPLLPCPRLADNIFVGCFFFRLVFYANVKIHEKNMVLIFKVKSNFLLGIGVVASEQIENSC